ncbi:hypothetical protein [Streptomyces sp. Da 82-17]|uniref:hypothetical protein n=1 Tax=Streptomyces sp. Da 82-17 TaxID=3377116 RepID=UPI0038D4CF6F
MAKGPAVIGVLTEPAPPTWWKANRHYVFLVLGLVLGYLLFGQDSDATPKHPAPVPARTAPATSSDNSPTPSASH